MPNEDAKGDICMPGMTPRKVVLALLYAPGKTGAMEPISGITRFEKMLFLLTSNKFRDVFNDLDYAADNFGPYSGTLVDLLENLSDLDLIEKEKGKIIDVADEANSYDGRTIPDVYRLTDYGSALAESIFNSLSGEERREITQMKSDLNSMSLDALLGYVYNTVDAKWLENSHIREAYTY